MYFINTYFNGVRPIFRNWIAVIQPIFCSDTSSLFNLQMWCWWIGFTVPFISSTQCTCWCVYLHSSLSMCPNLTQKPHTSLRKSQPIHLFWPSWWDQVFISFSFRAVFYNVVTGKWRRSTTLFTKATEEKWVVKLILSPLQTNVGYVCTDALEVGWLLSHDSSLNSGSVFH